MDHSIKNKKIITAAVFSAVFLLASSPAKAQNLSVPFTSQAPNNNWHEPWKNACEETSVAMVDSFYRGENIDKKNAKSKILNILTIKNKTLGYSLDENANKIATLINNYLPWSAKIVADPTIEQIKQELDNKQPVIIPVYGKALHNPHFRSGGPIYHMLVISGYDDDKNEFITQEPGTRFGLDFRYSYATIINAIHDFLPRNKTAQGKKIAIFTSPDLNESGTIDADKDGLTKAEEIQQGTSPWLKDTDGDGYADGVEVQNGYSPIIKSKNK